MRISRLTVATAFISSFSLFACSSSDGDGTGTSTGPDDGDPQQMGGGSTTPPAVGDCDPNAEIPCVAGFAEPCEGLESGWDGDEYCLAPPDPGRGLQLHVGPTDYSDPDDYGRFVINPGEETNWAEVTTSTNDETVYTNGYYSFMRPGSHHFILFGLPLDTMIPQGAQQTGGGTESAVGALDGEFLAGATRAIQTAVLDSPLEEEQGIAGEMPPHRPLAVNLHFINTQDIPLIQEIWVNFRTIPLEEVQRWAKPITWYGGLAMNIPPGTHTTLTNAGATECTAPTDIWITGMTGHVHANTIRYNASMQRVGDAAPTILFEDYDWHEPSEFRFSNALDNNPPDPATDTAGAYSGRVEVGPGDQFFWECEIQNQSNVNLTFSNKVYDGEMCNVFGFYSSLDKNQGPWLCAFF